MKKRIIICDYPSNYSFPNLDMGSAEKRIWLLAKTFLELNFEVIITGPLWLKKYLPGALHFKSRLGPNNIDQFLKEFGRADYLFAGHEYFDKDDIVKSFLLVANKLFTFIGHVYNFSKPCFNQKNIFAFCYSEEIRSLYKDQLPIKIFSFHGGINEEFKLVKKPKNYLVWMGRIDKDKSPHYAILAAKILNIPIYILGKTCKQPEYKKEYHSLLNDPMVKRCGMVSGDKKMKLISEAICGIYTLDKDYTEAGAAFFCEVLKCGVPVAGMTWKGNDAVCEALNSGLGYYEKIDYEDSDIAIGKKIAGCVQSCLKLDRDFVYKIANEQYNPKKLAIKMIQILDK